MSSERAARAGVPAGHSRPAIVLHWLVATGVLIQFSLGWWMRTLPDKTGVQAYWYNLHKSVGLTVFLAVVVLLVVRFSQPPAALPDAMPAWQRRAARVVHFLLYACVLVMPITGYMGSSFTRFPIRYFGVVLPNFWGWDAPDLKALCSAIHLGTVILFMSLVALHIAAALWHLARRDGLFQRMWR
jgi:cytochrome b561